MNKILSQRTIIAVTLCFLLSLSCAMAQNCTNAVDSAFINVTPTHCDNKNGKIVIDSVWQGTQPVTYSLNSVTYQPSNIFPNLDQGSYTLKVKDANGCIYNYPQAITITKITGPTTFNSSTTSVSACNTNDGKITINVSGGTLPYSFSLNGGTAQTSNIFTSLAAGSYAITVTDAGGCDSTTMAFVPNQTGITSGTASVTNSACNTPTGSIAASTTGSTPQTYQLNTATAQASPTFNNVAVGNYQITVTDINNCKYVIYNISVDQVPVQKGYTVMSVTDTCSRNKGAIVAGEANTGNPPEFSFALDNGSYQTSTVIPGFGVMGTAFQNLSVGTKTLHIKDASGCVFDTLIQVTTTTKPTATVTPNPTDCSPNNGSISITNISGGISPYTKTVNGSTTLTGLAEGTYQVIISDIAKCNDTSQVVISQKNTITYINATATNVTCGESFGSIIITGVQGGSSPITYTLDGATASGTTSNVQVGAHQLRAVDSKGCDHDTIIEVTQTKEISCSIETTPPSIIQGESTTLSATTVGTKNTWKSVVGLTIPDEADVTVAPIVTTTFVLTSQTEEGCIATCSTTVEVIPKIIPFKTFTPNGDNKNDSWKITNLEDYAKAEINTYSRWGQMVYRKGSSEKYTEWDGKNLGSYVPAGTYYYVIDLNVDGLPKSQNLYTGFVEVIR